MDQNKIGKYIEKLRKSKDLTQKELADKLGVSNTAVSKWETGCNLPDISMLEPLSEVLGVDIMEILGSQNTNTKYAKVKRKRVIRQRIYLSIIILLIIFMSITIYISQRTIYNYSEGAKIAEEQRVRVYRIISADERLNITGYLIMNNEKSILFVNELIYYDENSGTKKEIFTDKLTIYFHINNDRIYNSEIVSPKSIKKSISDLISNYKINVNIENNNALLDINNTSDNNFIIIKINLNTKSEKEEIKLNIELNEVLINK